MLPFNLAAFITYRLLYPLALLLGFLQAVAFDNHFDFSLLPFGNPLSLLSLFGFLLILQYLTPKRAMLFGYCFGLGLFAWGLNWVYISMSRFGGAPLSFAVLANAGVVVYLALYWLLAAYLITKVGRTSNQRLLLAAPIIALLEWLRSVFLIGFPWLSLGYSAVGHTIARDWAPLGGVFLVTCMLVLEAALLVFIFNRVSKAADSNRQSRYFWIAVGFFPAAKIILLVLQPFWLPLQPSSDTPTATVALVQGNMPVITDYDEARMMQNLLQYMRLTDKLLADDDNRPDNKDNKETQQQIPEVIIWPEAAIPYFYRDAKDFLSSIHNSQRQKGFDLITGVPQVNIEKEQYYNSILLQSKTPSKPQFYNKQHLLPFGEYLPFRPLFSFFKDYVDIPMSDFSRGTLIQSPFIAGGLSFAPGICFEAVFGDEVRQNARHAQVLLNVSNDAWFGKSKAQFQHFTIARMRAIENYKYLVRATNNGLTAIVNPSGEVVAALTPFKDGVLQYNISGYKVETLYARYGDKPWLLLFVLWIALVYLSGRQVKVRSGNVI